MMVVLSRRAWDALSMDGIDPPTLCAMLAVTVGGR